MQPRSGGKYGRVTTFLIVSGLISFAACNMDPDSEDFILDDIKWGLTNKNKTDTCILLNGIIQVLIPYETDRTYLSDMTLLTVPRSASVSGSCGDPFQNITLTWRPLQSRGKNQSDDSASDKHFLKFGFVKRGELVEEPNDTFSQPYFELDSVSGLFHANQDEFPGFNPNKKQFTFEANNLGMLSAPVSLSYFCQATQEVASETKESSLLLSLMQAQAFHEGLSDTSVLRVDYGPRSYCPKDGFRMILTVVGFVFFLSLLGAVVFLIVNWKRPRRAGYWSI